MQRRQWRQKGVREVTVVRAFIGGLLLGPLALGTALLLDGCGEVNDGSGGKRIVLETRVTVRDGDEQFDTAFGWKVKLDSAYLAGGALYYFDGAPPVARAPAQREWPFALQRWLGLKPVAAHPGHYTSGDALGEMLESWSVDVLAGTQALPVGNGITGTYRSASFSFSNVPRGAEADALDGHAAVVRGTATLDGQEPRHFVAMANFEDIEKSVSDAAVYGCRFHEVNVTEDGTVTVRVKPAVWFELVDFGELDPGTQAEPAEFPADSQPRIAFTQGLAELSAYEFTYGTE